MKKKPSPKKKETKPNPQDPPTPYTSATDPQGSYTGVCADPKEIPTQDADDL